MQVTSEISHGLPLCHANEMHGKVGYNIKVTMAFLHTDWLYFIQHAIEGCTWQNPLIKQRIWSWCSVVLSQTIHVAKKAESFNW